MRNDLTGKSHWDQVYAHAVCGESGGWQPTTYTEKSIEFFLMEAVQAVRPRNILEVGCGNSVWLPYLGQKTGAKVFGIDYSEEGCRLAKENLVREGVTGEIICGDIFELAAADIGTFDLVYSLGLVEHFTSLTDILGRLAQFAGPCGTVLTEVPNLYSVHGCMAGLYQPALLAKHRTIKMSELVKAYRDCGLDVSDYGYAGLFSFGIVAWGLDQRFPRLDALILPVVRTLSKMTEKLLAKTAYHKGCSLLSPFLYVYGSKPSLRARGTSD
ncbi:class I SAM-dependent methyltransferase [Desulfuromonas carbonis]